MHDEIRKALVAAEQEYLQARGWTRHNEKFWVAPQFKNYRYWGNVFPGDRILHESAMATQKDFEAHG